METCYRHDERETGRHCTRCARAACSDCLRPASVGSHCLDCVRAAAPPVAERVRIQVATAGPVLTYIFLAANLAAFVVVPGSGPRLAEYALWAPAIDINGEWWRIITSGFLHGSVMHIAFNMFALYRIGPVVEQTLGWLRFLGVYVISLLGGSFLAMVLEPESPAVGASGALFGLFGALWVLYQRGGINPWRTGIGSLIVINLLITFAVPIISVGGHVGGLLAGGAAAFMLSPERTGWRSNTSATVVIIVVGVAAMFSAALVAANASTPL